MDTLHYSLLCLQGCLVCCRMQSSNPGPLDVAFMSSLNHDNQKCLQTLQSVLWKEKDGQKSPCREPVVWGHNRVGSLQGASSSCCIPKKSNRCALRDFRSLVLEGHEQGSWQCWLKPRKRHIRDFSDEDAQLGAHQPDATSVIASSPEKSCHLIPICPPD